MNCPKCGQDQPKGSFFCQYCGEQLPKRKIPVKKIASLSLIAILSVSSILFCGLYINDEIKLSEIENKNASKVEELNNDIATLTSQNASLLIDLNTANETIKKKEQEISDLEEEIYFYEDYFDQTSWFVYGSAKFITSEGSKYHNFDCYHLIGYMDEYWIHNVEYCEYLGYTACKDCN